MGLKIARLVSGFPPDFNISGGLLPNIYYLSQEEIKSGHETAIFTSGEPREGENIDGVPIYRTPKAPLSRVFLGEMLIKTIKKTGFTPDVIHSMNAMPLGWLYQPEMSRQLGAKCVLSIHTPVLQTEGFSPSMRYIINTEYALLLRRLVKLVDLNLVVSRFVKRELVATGVSEKEIRIIPSGLRNEIFKARPLKEPGKRGITCLYVGRFARIKGLGTLIRAARIIRDRGDFEVRFLLVGGTPGDDDYLRVRRMISDLGLQHTVIMCPPVTHHEIPNTYGQCDCFVLPSNREPLGKVVLEAMSSHRPVVASDAGGIPDLVWDGKTGLLFESGNPESLATRLCEVFRNRSRVRKITRRSVGFTKRFDWGEISRMYIDAFNLALEMGDTGVGMH